MSTPTGSSATSAAIPTIHTAIGVGYGLERFAMLRYGIDDIRKVDVAASRDGGGCGPLVGRVRPKQLDGAGFSGAIWPEYGGDAARLQPERDVGERDNFAIFLGNSSQLGNHGCTFVEVHMICERRVGGGRVTD